MLPNLASKVASATSFSFMYLATGFLYGQHNWFVPLDSPASVAEDTVPDLGARLRTSGRTSDAACRLLLANLGFVRAIPDFEIADEAGQSVAGTGVAQDGQFANGIVGYARMRGRFALGTSRAIRQASSREVSCRI